MDPIKPYLLLEYIYNRFLVPFVLILLGSILAELFNHKKKTKINLIQLFSNSIVFTVIICAAISIYQVNIPFEAYVAICVVFGLLSWKFKLIRVLFDKKLMLSIISKLLKTCSKPMAKAASLAFEELEESDKSNRGKKRKPPSTTTNNNNKKNGDNAN